MDLKNRLKHSDHSKFWNNHQHLGHNLRMLLEEVLLQKQFLKKTLLAHNIGAYPRNKQTITFISQLHKICLIPLKAPLTSPETTACNNSMIMDDIVSP